MANEYGTVEVILRTRQKIPSPELPRNEAEQVLADIGKARETGASISLPWLSVSGKDVLAVHLELRSESKLEQLARAELD